MDMSVWYLVGAVLVFFMQCGFAMVETGFTRAKNAGNIIMKNLMDFCIGTVVFMLLGYGIMNSEHYFFGLIGMPEYQLFTDFYDFNWSNFFFQLVFCATAATTSPGLWRSGRNSCPTASTPPSSAQWSTPSRRAGYGTARAGWLSWALWTSPAPPSSTWWAASPPSSGLSCLVPALASTPNGKTALSRSTPSPATL